MPEMYFCLECKKRHRTGKIYQNHLKFKEKPTNSKRELLLIKLAKINRMISFGNYRKKDVVFLKGIKLKIEEKLK